MSDMDRVLSVKTVADLLNVSVRTVYRMEDRGQLQRVQLTERCFGFRQSDVAALMSSGGVRNADPNNA